MITQSLNTNLIPGQVCPRLNVSQYDKSSRTLSFALYNGSQAFNITSGMTALIEGTKPDGHGFQYAASVTVGSNIVTATLTQQMACVAGDVVCELAILKTGERLATANFIISVEPAALGDSAIISDSELPLLIALATEQMENAEAWAEGTKNGVPVSPSDPQYQHNAKYWADQVENFSDESEKWARGTVDGVPVPSTDETYHNNSKYYAEQAADSATSASGSASDASGSASDAETQALKSEGYAVGTQDGTAVESGTYYHNNAKYYSEEAAASASEAAAASSNPPYIGENGHWYIYNTTTQAYVDSGVDASITVSIADITMLEPAETPYVTNSGTDTDPIFHLFIPRGKGISSITKTGTSGLVDTYTITYSDGYTSTFTVTNGKTAYESAVDGGYPGTEQEFEDDLANFENYKTAAVNAANNASTSATNANQSYLDAKAEADRAQLYADFIEPHFIIQNNRLYINDPAVAEFLVANNRLYVKFIA